MLGASGCIGITVGVLVGGVVGGVVVIVIVVLLAVVLTKFLRSRRVKKFVSPNMYITHEEG